MNELAGHSLGGYHLEEEVGRGSMGVVYRGKQIALGREVAIKVLPQNLAKDTSYVARFIREAQIIAGLNHPNIVHIYDAGQQHKLLYFVMEFVQGPTLASLLSLDGVIPQHLAVEYAAQIADALDVAYRERNVIHRDIKPENLMLNRWGKVKVMDFGLARAVGLQVITVAKTLVGSIYYSSPEQIWGDTLDNRSDIYALGVVLYEMVTGRRPFVGRSIPELTQTITGGPLQPPSVYNAALLPQLEHIILTALSRDREERYNAASIMAQELRALSFPPVEPGNTLPPANATAREQSVIQPPKRPRVQRPRYLTGDANTSFSRQNQQQQPPATPAPYAEELAQLSPTRQPTQQLGTGANYPSLPQQPYSRPAATNVQNMTSRDRQQENTNQPVEAQEQERPKIWNQFQRMFKTSTRRDDLPPQ